MSEEAQGIEQVVETLPHDNGGVIEPTLSGDSANATTNRDEDSSVTGMSTSNLTGNNGNDSVSFKSVENPSSDNVNLDAPVLDAHHFDKEENQMGDFPSSTPLESVDAPASLESLDPISTDSTDSKPPKLVEMDKVGRQENETIAEDEQHAKVLPPLGISEDNVYHMENSLKDNAEGDFNIQEKKADADCKEQTTKTDETQNILPSPADDERKTKDTEKPEAQSNEPSTSFDGHTRLDLETINRKRQEEKEVFIKLIDDVTRLEKEKENMSKTIDQLQTKYDICSIELDSEKEKTADQMEKELSAIQSKLAATEVLLQRETPESQNLVHSHQHINPSQMEEELHDLRLKLKVMVEHDEQKSSHIERLESIIKHHEETIRRVEEELGKERLTQLKEQTNGSLRDRRKSLSPQPNTNQIHPTKPASKVCTIL